MNDRRRLLALSLAILAAASLACVTLSAWHLRQAYRLEDAAGSLWIRAASYSALQAGALIIAAGTLMARVFNPFMWRLEQSEARSQRHVALLEELTQRLAAKTSELTRINADLDDFSCIASHDLKEPLRGISGYCELLLLEDYRDKLDEDGTARLESVIRLCGRLGRLIDDLLTYARLGRVQPSCVAVDLNRVAADVTDILAATIEDRAARVTVAASMPAVVAEPTLVGEVLRNLISNALKFNTHAEPHVRVGAERDGDLVVVSVRDNGIGIAPEHHTAVFEMFRRLHSRQRYEGTGAGLSFVRKIVEAHGGRVWLESALERGSTFYFTLPADARQAVDAALPAYLAPPALMPGACADAR
jgi:light-regulated signal transduction histidine kinase (bacteriophytochrome)